MSKNITLRNANIGDAADLVILDNLASHGLSLWFWQGAVADGMANNALANDALEWGRQRMADANSPFGYSNAVVAEVGGLVAGAAVGYILNEGGGETLKIKNPVMKPIFELFAQRDGEWLLDSLAVYSDQTKQGVGAMLLDDCFKRARVAGADKLCLVVEDNNETALSLYYRQGFIERDRRVCVPYKNGIETKYWVLMSAPVN